MTGRGITGQGMEDTVPCPAPLAVDGAPAADLWPLEAGVRHLNHGSFGAVPSAVLAHQAELRRSMESSPVAWFGGVPARVARAREEVAAQLGVPADRTALVQNASAGASVAYWNLRLPAGADVVVTDHGYGAVSQGARRAALRVGGTLTVARVPLAASDDDVVASVMDAVTERTALVVLDQITSGTARLFPVERICDEARARGVLTLVDGAHSPGVLATPVVTAADVWVGNLHKFGCAPRGCAALVARPDVAQSLFPLIDSWGGTSGFPDRFDHQGTTDVTSFLSAPFAWSYLERTLGWSVIRDYTAALADYAQAVVTEAMSAATGEDCRVDVGRPIAPYRLVALPAPLGHTREAADALRQVMLDELGIAVAFTSFAGRGYCRLSTHAYTVGADYEDFAERAVPWLVRRATAAG